MSSLRVAHLIPQGVNPYSGLLVAACRLAAALRTEGYGVELWQFGDLSPEAEEVVQEAEIAGVERLRLAGLGPASPRGTIDEVISRGRADVAHLHGVFNTVNVRVASRLPMPYVVTPHGGYASGSLAYHPIRKRIFRGLFELPMLKRAEAVGALTEAEAREIRAFGVTGDVPVIPNGVDRPPVDIDRLRFRREHGIPDDAPLATYIGRIDVRAKRLDALIHGLASAPDWHVAIVGGDFRDGVATLKRMVEDAGLSERAWILPPRRGDRLQEVLASSDVFVLLSRSEGMPMALLESSALGIPAIVSQEVERSVGIVEAGAGWCANPEDLGRALMDWSRAGREIQDRLIAGAKEYSQRFEWRAVARCYGKVYEGVLRNG